MNESEELESGFIISNLSAVKDEILNSNGSWASLMSSNGFFINGPSTPLSPSPTCSSPAAVLSPSFFSAITSSEHDFINSTPLNLQITSRVISNNEGNNEVPLISTIIEEENKISNSSCLCSSKDSKKDQKTKGKSVRTYTFLASTSSTTTEPKQKFISYHSSASIEESIASTYGDSKRVESIGQQDRERYFRNFISGVRRRNVEVKVENWKEAKSTKLINNLRKKEASINAWKLNEIERANMYLKEAEVNLEKKRMEARKKMDKKIRSAWRKAEEKKAKERQSAAKKISNVSKLVDHVVVVGVDVFNRWMRENLKKHSGPERNIIIQWAWPNHNPVEGPM